jgi:hypothetical protein
LSLKTFKNGFISAKPGLRIHGFFGGTKDQGRKLRMTMIIQREARETQISKIGEIWRFPGIGNHLKGSVLDNCTSISVFLFPTCALG